MGTGNLDYWNGLPILFITGGSNTLLLGNWESLGPVEVLDAGTTTLSVDVPAAAGVDITPQSIAGMECAVVLGEPPNIAMDAATVANTEIAVAVYTENIQMTPMDAGAIYIVKPDAGQITVGGQDASGSIATHRTFPIAMPGRTTQEPISSGERIFPIKR